MLKEVGASGQISLGKKYAGQLFDVVFYPDGRVELVPMKAVPDVQSTAAAPKPAGVHEEAGTYRVGDGWLTPERLAARKAALERSPEETERLARHWETENQHVIDSMNRHYEAVGSMGWRMYEWRKKQAAAADTASGQQPRSQRKS
ncbi:hypothetical protein [Polaromonas sp.]|uniref:hypothetical protein n=1 Tax=Polaromonas sp. TaxID=1869339 RepID=UPI003565B067